MSLNLNASFVDIHRHPEALFRVTQLQCCKEVLNLWGWRQKTILHSALKISWPLYDDSL